MNTKKTKVRQGSFKYHSNLMTIEEVLAFDKYSNYDFKEYKNDKEINHEIELISNKVKQLYIDDNTENFQIQNINLLNQGKSFITKKNINEDKIDELIKLHLLGNQTIGCYPADSEHQKYFLFDIDVSTMVDDKNDIRYNKQEKEIEKTLFLANKRSKKIYSK